MKPKPSCKSQRPNDYLLESQRVNTRDRSLVERQPNSTRHNVGSNPTGRANRYTVRAKQERPIRGVKQVTRHAQGDRASAAAAARPESIRPSHSF